MIRTRLKSGCRRSEPISAPHPLPTLPPSSWLKLGSQKRKRRQTSSSCASLRWKCPPQALEAAACTSPRANHGYRLEQLAQSVTTRVADGQHHLLFSNSDRLGSMTRRAATDPRKVSSETRRD